MNENNQAPEPAANTEPAATHKPIGGPDITKTIAVMAGGCLLDFLNSALGEAARGVQNTESKVKGKVALELTIEQAKGGAQLLISHKAAYKRPTPTGDIAETITGETAMYANARGALSLVPDAQQRLF